MYIHADVCSYMCICKLYEDVWVIGHDNEEHMECGEVFLPYLNTYLYIYRSRYICTYMQIYVYVCTYAHIHNVDVWVIDHDNGEHTESGAVFLPYLNTYSYMYRSRYICICMLIYVYVCTYAHTHNVDVCVIDHDNDEHTESGAVFLPYLNTYLYAQKWIYMYIHADICLCMCIYAHTQCGCLGD